MTMARTIRSAYRRARSPMRTARIARLPDPRRTEASMSLVLALVLNVGPKHPELDEHQHAHECDKRKRHGCRVSHVEVAESVEKDVEHDRVSRLLRTTLGHLVDGGEHVERLDLRDDDAE